MMVRDADDARAEHDPLGARGGDRHEDLGRRDDLPSGRVMLADEGLVVAQPVEAFDQLQIALERKRRVLAEPVQLRHEVSDFLIRSLCASVADYTALVQLTSS